MASSPRRKSPKSPALPIDLEEIEQDPGFRGMLSFLEVSPEQRTGTPAVSPVDEPPAGDKASAEVPLGQIPEAPADEQPVGYSPQVQPPAGYLRRGPSSIGHIPYMEVEGRGKRPLRFCLTAQDGHTASEQLVYQALWEHARKFGEMDESGAALLDIGLAQLCLLLNTDHKNVKRLLGSLQEKLAIEVVRQPDYRLAIPTRYRIFPSDQILARRQRAGLVWVIRTRTIRFVALETVTQLMADRDSEVNPPVGQ